MRRKRSYSYLFLCLFFLVVFTLPPLWTHSLRCGLVTLISPIWQGGQRLRTSLSPPDHPLKKERDHLKGENITLKRQNASLRKRLFSDEKIESRLEKIKAFEQLQKSYPELEAFFKRRGEAGKKLLDLECKTLVAQVIYRDSSTWNETIWINVGKKNNQACQAQVVALGSPVLSGSYLIGVVDDVGEKKSRVRLLTNASIVPSVRAVRGNGQNRALLEVVELLIHHLTLQEDGVFPLDGSQMLHEKLEEFKERLRKDSGEHYLAKGELYSTTSPLWRACSSRLRGVGFNYDFADQEGPARELKSGAPLDQLTKEESIPLIQVGDLLVTTGFDGVFPADLPVALVAEVKPLEEGAPSYEIEAELRAGNLEYVREVVVLPSLSSY